MAQPFLQAHSLGAELGRQTGLWPRHPDSHLAEGAQCVGGQNVLRCEDNAIRANSGHEDGVGSLISARKGAAVETAEPWHCCGGSPGLEGRTPPSRTKAASKPLSFSELRLFLSLTGQ